LLLEVLKVRFLEILLVLELDLLEENILVLDVLLEGPNLRDFLELDALAQVLKYYELLALFHLLDLRLGEILRQEDGEKLPLHRVLLVDPQGVVLDLTIKLELGLHFLGLLTLLIRFFSGARALLLLVGLDQLLL